MYIYSPIKQGTGTLTKTHTYRYNYSIGPVCCVLMASRFATIYQVYLQKTCTNQNFHIQPLRSVLARNTFCSNDCYESFWVGVGLYQLYTVR